jgi:hypothetical protein
MVKAPPTAPPSARKTIAGRYDWSIPPGVLPPFVTE